ncbi:MAG: NAD-dependent epimerase/dehydratase family protein [Phycisphaerae bacterium]|nr:NAD-dependent epimerase/dehydratase family protein [Phycisphaerae bacterium]
MNALVLGGTGLISTGIVKHLLARDANLTVFNRGQRASTLSPEVKQIHGNRDDLQQLKSLGRFDVVIDMICFRPEQAQIDLAAFTGQCDHFIFCSTVCTYGVKVPPGVLVDETFPQEPISDYGRNKLACEKLFLQAYEQKQLNVTIIRPSHTYGPGSPMIDQLDFDASSWDRIERGQPVLCGGDGLGLWVSTHRDDCGKLFAYGALNPKTFGQCYNATRDQQFTWADLYRQTAAAMGKPADVLFMPSAWIIGHDPQRFGLLREITQFHGAYSSTKAKRDVPEFTCKIDYPNGAADTLEDIRRRGAWKDSSKDELYQRMVEKAIDMGIQPQRL